MEKMMVKMRQVLMLLLVAALIFITPLLSTSLRHTYIYFIINLLIIALGAEAGLLKALSNPLDHHNQDHNKIIKTSTTPLDGDKTMITTTINNGGDHKNNIKVVEKSKSEKMVGAVVKTESIMKKCPSMPSLFFIEGGDGDQARDQEDVVVNVVEEEEEEEEDMSGQELFTKAETFIGNFYKQLKMQREEDSWKRIHGFYQKAF